MKEGWSAMDDIADGGGNHENQIWIAWTKTCSIHC